MLFNLISETRKALDAELFHVALQSALTIPDICACVEYPKLKDNIAERYIQWCEAHLECCKDTYYRENSTPRISGEAIYNLRNNVLHAGHLDVEKRKFKRDPLDALDKLILVYGMEGFHISTQVDLSAVPGGRVVQGITTTVEALVNGICDAGEESYRAHQAAYDAQPDHLVDLRAEMKAPHPPIENPLFKFIEERFVQEIQRIQSQSQDASATESDGLD